MVEKTYAVKVHRVQACQHCGQALKRRKAGGYDMRQVYDPPKVEMQVIEHRAGAKVSFAPKIVCKNAVGRCILYKVDLNGLNSLSVSDTRWFNIAGAYFGYSS